MTWAKPGVKCVCVLPRPAGADPNAVYPEVGGIYTVRAVKPKGYGGVAQTVLMLEEISNEHIKPEPYEPGFAVRGFRPLITKSKEDDVALFRHLLDETRQEIPA